MSARNRFALVTAIVVAAAPAAAAALACECDPCPLGAPADCDGDRRDCCDPPEAPSTCPCIHPEDPEGLPVEGEASIPSCTTSAMGEVHLPAPLAPPRTEARPAGPDPPPDTPLLYLKHGVLRI